MFLSCLCGETLKNNSLNLGHFNQGEVVAYTRSRTAAEVEIGVFVSINTALG